MTDANLAVVRTTLANNGITFSLGDEVEALQTTSPMVPTYYPSLPRAYFGLEKDDKFGIGLKVAMDASGVGSKYTHDDKFRPIPLYQPTLTPEQLSVVNYTPPPQPWTPDQQAHNTEMEDQMKALHEVFKNDCTRKEALGITALVIAEMLGLSRGDLPIIRHNRKYEVVNSIEVGDLVYIQNVFKFLTGRSLTVNVTSSNDMEFNDIFYM